MPNKPFTLRAPDIEVGLCAAGASVTSVNVWRREVALSPACFETGAADPSHAGNVIAPCCGRVRGGEIEIDGEGHALARNEGPNHLHGGFHGAANQAWTLERRSPAEARFALDLPDGLDGYPGHRRLTVEYAVSGCQLSAVFSAVTDRPTWLDMTSHLYWDLTGRFDGAAMGQLLEIAAQRAVMNDAAHLPVGIVPAAGPFDFTSPAAPGEYMRAFPDCDQFAIARGYNNAFLLDGALQEKMGFAARLTAPEAGLRMALITDQPAIVFYSGGFLGQKTQLRGGSATPGCALALEAQSPPDPFHLPGAAPRILRPGETWQKRIIWRFERL